MSLVLTALLLLNPPADPLLEWGSRVHDNGGLTVDLITEYREITEALAPIVLAPQPKPRVAAPVPVSTGAEYWRPLIEAHFSPANVPWAMRVMTCESKGDPSAQNSRSSAGGLFQFIDSTWAATPYGHLSKYDPEANIAAAAWLLEVPSWGGPKHWACK
jgi:soluble lytic murein transglycosylase-like protein